MVIRNGLWLVERYKRNLWKNQYWEHWEYWEKNSHCRCPKVIQLSSRIDDNTSIAIQSVTGVSFQPLRFCDSVIGFAPFLTAVIIFCRGVKGANMIVDMKLESRNSLCFCPFRKEELHKDKMPELQRPMELSRAQFIPFEAFHPLNKSLGKAQIQAWSLGTICVKATECKIAI